MYTVQQVAQISHVSVRTLHHYDKLGLLPPRKRSEGGYRLYGEAELIRLKRILFLRELDFPLREIRMGAEKAACASRSEKMPLGAPDRTDGSPPERRGSHEF